MAPGRKRRHGCGCRPAPGRPPPAALPQPSLAWQTRARRSAGNSRPGPERAAEMKDKDKLMSKLTQKHVNHRLRYSPSTLHFLRPPSPTCKTTQPCITKSAVLHFKSSESAFRHTTATQCQFEDKDSHFTWEFQGTSLSYKAASPAKNP